MFYYYCYYYLQLGSVTSSNICHHRVVFIIWTVVMTNSYDKFISMITFFFYYFYVKMGLSHKKKCCRRPCMRVKPIRVLSVGTRLFTKPPPAGYIIIYGTYIHITHTYYTQTYSGPQDFYSEWSLSTDHRGLYILYSTLGVCSSRYMFKNKKNPLFTRRTLAYTYWCIRLIIIYYKICGLRLVKWWRVGVCIIIRTIIVLIVRNSTRLVPYTLKTGLPQNPDSGM